jgi:hypothetical protein
MSGTLYRPPPSLSHHASPGFSTFWIGFHNIFGGYHVDEAVFYFIDWRIIKDVYDKKHEEYHEKIQLLNIELEEHTRADHDYQTTVAVVVSVARRLGQSLKVLKTKRNEPF